jgi:hypothetical protein
MTDEAYRAQAREIYGSDDIEIDDDAKESASPEGAFVQAWVWVSKMEAAA